MKDKIIRALIKPSHDSEINEEACNAAGWYVRQQGKHLSMLDQQNMANQIAHGFAMGWKEREKKLGIRE